MSLPGKISLKTAHGQYLSARPDDVGWALRQVPWKKGWELFDVIEISRNLIALKTAHGKYVSARTGDDGWMVRQMNDLQGWEKFELMELGGNRISLKTNHSRFVSARGSDDSWNVRQTEWRQGWEEFEVHDTSAAPAKINVTSELGKVVMLGYLDTKVVWEGLNSHVEHREKFKVLTASVNVPEGDRGKWLAFFACVAASSAITAIIGTYAFGPLTLTQLGQIVAASSAVCYGAIQPGELENAEGGAEIIGRWGDWHRV